MGRSGEKNSSSLSFVLLRDKKEGGMFEVSLFAVPRNRSLLFVRGGLMAYVIGARGVENNLYRSLL